MKYVLASLLAVGLIGGSQVVTYGQDCGILGCHKEEQGAKGTGKVDTNGERFAKRPGEIEKGEGSEKAGADEDKFKVGAKCKEPYCDYL